ncbi:flagellar basal body-associated FliL family protein [Pseudoruegeria sp. SK021]|uniref:flagellar basal body-associated FliL family protein n=1 Tax=Pseudoruegeria sp. SK021 TaxID=1933035 RepID=UPI000A258B0C|nr:flagellar basal body-associated FliL family protein [Pseudoruegeria sp. SK021]OSP54752.1 hypothetical protein BV911_11355 [Pseudoruegeria sp. SK021]
MGKLIPVILALAGLGGGVGAGLLLRPEPDLTETVAHGDTSVDEHGSPTDPSPGAAAVATCAPTAAVSGHDLPANGTDPATEFVKFSNQFVIPVMGPTKVKSMVVLSLSVEVDKGAKDAVYEREPKIRDAFLRVLFDHANAGGFDGNFTSSVDLDILRAALREAAVGASRTSVRDVLIVDLVRQDV